MSTFHGISDVCDRMLMDEIQGLKNSDKIWFLETILMHKGCAKYLLESDKIFILQSLFKEISQSLGPTFDIGPFLRDYIDSILEFCPIEHVSLALVSLGCKEKLIVCLQRYVSKKIAQGSFDENTAMTCKRFFEDTQGGIAFLLSIAILQTPTGKFLLTQPGFFESIPEIYQQEIQTYQMLLEPIKPDAFDPLSITMKRLPLGLKELLVEDSPFSSFFENEVMGRVLSLYNQGCISANEMFFLATRLPYNTFLEVAEKCPADFSELESEIAAYGRSTSISNHILDFFMMIQFGDSYAEEELREFLNRSPKLLIGEGRWIQYLAQQVPMLFSRPLIQKIFELIPMDLIPFVVQFVMPEHYNWLLNARFEAIYSKNIAKFSPEVLSWLLQHFERWFVVRKDVIEYTLFLWERPRRNLSTKIDLLEETSAMFCTFQQRYCALQSLQQNLNAKPGSEKLQALLEELGQIKGVITPWHKMIDQIDVKSISDILDGELLEGDVYSLEEYGWILKKTRDRLLENPYNRKPFLSIEDKDQRMPPLNQEELNQLEDLRLKIATQINELRNTITEKRGSNKRMAPSLS